MAIMRDLTMKEWTWHDAYDLLNYMNRAIEYAAAKDMIFSEAYAFLTQSKNNYFDTINPGHSCIYMDIYDISSYSIDAGKKYYPKDIGTLFIIIYCNPEFPNETYSLRATFPKEKREEMN